MMTQCQSWKTVNSPTSCSKFFGVIRMSKELEDLMLRVKLRQYQESPPKKLLYHILDVIERESHYGRKENWNLLVELLDNWIVQHEDLSLGSCACKPFDGLELKHEDLYNRLNDLDLFRHYVVAAHKQPWDHIGEVFEEQRLFGPGQNLTPRAVVELMVKMTLGEVNKFQTVLDTWSGPD